MGKWSTYRKRGSPTAALALLPPPAPTLTTDAGAVLQNSAVTDDAGGQCKLQTSPTGGDPWTDYGDAPWEEFKNWGDHVDFPGLHLRAREQGNNVNYTGLSEWSNILEPAL